MIRVVQDELAASTADAVLRPVSAEWTPVTPAMRRLDAAAGEAPLEQCRRLGELPVGSAVITGAGDLSAQFMVHIVIRSIDEPVTGSGVRRGLENGMRRVAEWGLQRVAMPPLGTGAGNLDAEEAAAIIIPVLTARVQAGGPPSGIDIHVESEYEHAVFSRLLAAAG